MKKILLRVLIVLTLVFALSWTVFADQPWILWMSSEWEATGFNNGVRFVRDSNGYFHAFWHSQADANAAPCGARGDIFYAYTTRPAQEPPSMAWQGAWATPINLTSNLHDQDNRYAAAAIEYEYYTGPWHNINRIHLVWQAILPNGTRYEVLYANFMVTNPPTNPGALMAARNLSNTPGTDSLVPAIAINRYLAANFRQSLHVVWQEEDIYPMTTTPEDLPFSDIAYIRSLDSGINWSGPAGGWFGHVWDNITQSNANSQMPSIACIADQYTGSPGGRPQDLGFNSNTVHVSYNVDTGANNSINVFYLKSPNNGLSWNPRINVSANTGGSCDAYSSIAVDLLDNPHFAFMRKGMIQREPTRSMVIDNYQPGINPALWRSFPGPEVGMYRVYPNYLTYAYFNGVTWASKTWESTEKDREFPTVSLDRCQNVNVNWQEYDRATNDYGVVRVTNINLVPPTYPVQLQHYQGWSAPVLDSTFLTDDELFPNLSFKKAAMYASPNERATAGYDEIWSMISGHGPGAAIAPSVKTIMQDGNVRYDTGL
jgi:hypothetical protein